MDYMIRIKYTNHVIRKHNLIIRIKLIRMVCMDELDPNEPYGSMLIRMSQLE